MSEDTRFLDTTVPGTFVIPDDAICTQWEAMKCTLPCSEEEAKTNAKGAATGETVLQATDSIRWDVRTNSFNDDGPRPVFPDTTKRAIPVGLNQDRCHLVSYKALSCSIAGILNYSFRPGQIGYLANLQNLYSSAYYLNNGPQQEASDAVVYINALQQLMNSDPARSAAYASHLAYALNASIGNLRAANATWNRSIGAQFDPIRWVYALTPNLGITESMQLIAFQNGVLWPGAVYLSDSVRQRLLPLSGMMKVSIPPISVYSARSVSLGNQYGYDGMFLFSSNNTFVMPDGMQAAQPVDIYFVSWLQP